MEELNEIITELEALLEAKDFYSIRTLLQDMEPADIASFLEELKKKVKNIHFHPKTLLYS